jgi:hypothetical protein
LSTEALADTGKVAQILGWLEDTSTFWLPTEGDDDLSWFNFYGLLDMGFYGGALENPAEEEGEDEDEEREIAPATSVNLSLYEPPESREARPGASGLIVSTYSQDALNKAIQLHESMVQAIATQCRSKGATVEHDPRTVDLLITLEDRSAIVEVKSTSPGLFVRKLRLAIGQVLHYGYLLHQERGSSPEMGIAFPVRIGMAWPNEFVGDYLKMNLISLGESGLVTSGPNPLLNKMLNP